jgi:hypothetical protein
MGKLWQAAENKELNTLLQDMKKEFQQEAPSLANIKILSEKAQDLAGSQNLLSTVASLKKLDAKVATGVDCTDDTTRPALYRSIDRITRDAQVREVALTDVNITRPTMVYLSGFLTNDDRNDYVIGSMRRMTELIGNRPEIRQQPDIYGWTHTDLKNLFNLAVYNTFPGTRSSQAGYRVGSAILMPLVAKDFAYDEKSGKASGLPLPPEEARKNLKNVTLFGYSAGTVVAQETYNATRKMMRQIGFDDKTASELLKDVVLISTGAISRTTKERDRYTTVTLIASNDRINRAKNWIWGTVGSALQYLKLQTSAWGPHSKDLTITPLSETSLHATTSIRPSLYEWQYDKDGQRSHKRPIDPLYPKWQPRRSYHELPPYITTDDKNNQFSRIALYSLINAFNRSGRITPQELIQIPANDTHSPELQDAYRKRIETALRHEIPKRLKATP